MSKHHYALELSDRGNRVFFLNPPILRRKQFVPDIETINNRLKVINYRPLVRGTNHFPYYIRKKFQSPDAKIIKCLIDKNIDILWSFDPYRFQYMQAFGAGVNLYHAVDVHRSRLEVDISRNADCILCSSDKILKRFIGLDCPHFKINHGLAQHFVCEDIVPKTKNLTSKVRVGYVGNLDYQYLDVMTLRTIVRENPSVDFHFIGPYGESNLNPYDSRSNILVFLKERSNVQLLGPKNSKDLPNLLRNYDLFLMCYSGDKNVSEMANPHKILEFLSTGKVVVSHYIDEYRDKRDLVEMVDNNCFLPGTFRNVVENLGYFNSTKKMQKRIEFARSNMYSAHLRKVGSIINSL